ncbi:MAG: preprotein translocase subunit SecG [Candidatus Edwardsbacteria bacterium]
MFGFLLMIHILTCIILILAVLLQSGAKGGGLASGFGGGGGEFFFGGRGAAPFLVKATSVLAIIFMLTSLSLALISARQVVTPKTAIQKELEKTRKETPPATTPEGSQQKSPFPAEEKK